MGVLQKKGTQNVEPPNSRIPLRYSYFQKPPKKNRKIFQRVFKGRHPRNPGEPWPTRLQAAERPLGAHWWQAPYEYLEMIFNLWLP